MRAKDNSCYLCPYLWQTFAQGGDGEGAGAFPFLSLLALFLLLWPWRLVTHVALCPAASEPLHKQRGTLRRWFSPTAHFSWG